MDWTPAKAIEDMDRGGVSTSVVSLSEPGVWFGDNASARRLARASNEYAAELSRTYPGRFAFFAVLPLPDVEGSLREIEYAMDVLGAVGVSMLTSVNGQYLGDAAFAPAMAELNRRKAVVFTHPVKPDCCHGLVPDLPDAAIEMTTDTSRAIASLLFSGTATRFPDIRWIFSHGGGTVPLLVGRLQLFAERPQAKRLMPHGVMSELSKFYYDTAQTCTAPGLATLSQFAPPSQILFGTDYPFASSKASADCLTAHLGARRVADIGRANARALFPTLQVARRS